MKARNDTTRRRFASSLPRLRSVVWMIVSLVCWSPCRGQGSFQVTVEERTGSDRVQEFTSFGVPLPRHWNVVDLSRLRLRDETGTSIPAQFEALARWGGSPHDLSAPVKWLLVSYLESIPAASSAVRILESGTPGPLPTPMIQLDESVAGKLLVDTGAALFEINAGADFNLIHQVTVQGEPLLNPLDADEAIRYRDVNGESLVAGAIPNWTARPATAAVERWGPLWAVIKVAGNLLDSSGRPVLNFTARLHFFGGRAEVRLDFTVENNHSISTGESNQPVNVHNQGSPNSVYIGDLELSLRPRTQGGALRVVTEQGVDVSAPNSPIRLYQDSSGTQYWDAYVGAVGWPGLEASAAPRLQSFCELPGYEITAGDTRLGGTQALGWMTVSAGDGEQAPFVFAAVRAFWQNFPKALNASPEGTLTVNLFPEGNRFRHNLRVGEEKTHSILYRFGRGGIEASEAERVATAFNQPLFGVARPSWYVETGALGVVPAVDLQDYPLYERYVRIAFEPNPDFDPGLDDPNFGNSTLTEALERFNFYGWQDYGDVPLDYEAYGENQAGQMNLKYWFLYGMLLQFGRSSDLKWLDLAIPAAWHLADIDYLHIPDEGIRHWAHGAYFGHSQHDEPGNLNPNRNSNSPSVDLFFGVPDLLLAYHLTGEERFHEVALEGLEAMFNLSSQFSDFSQPLFERERANLVFAFIEGYRNTGDLRWLEQLRRIVGQTADLSNKPWVTNPAAYGASHPGEYVRLFMFSQVLWTLGRYLDFCREYRLPDDLNVIRALTAFADFVLDFVMREYRPGRAAHPYDFVFDGSSSSYLDINNWALVMSDALAYAYRFSGRERYLQAAEQFYATGTIDPVWEDDPPVYLSSKDLVNACNWGLVFMRMSSEKPDTKWRRRQRRLSNNSDPGLRDRVTSPSAVRARH